MGEPREFTSDVNNPVGLSTFEVMLFSNDLRGGKAGLEVATVCRGGLLLPDSDCSREGETLSPKFTLVERGLGGFGGGVFGCIEARMAGGRATPVGSATPLFCSRNS